MYKQSQNQPINIFIGKADVALDPNVYSDVAAKAQYDGRVFVIAFDASGEVHRLASLSDQDRQIVGALAGTWVAEGYQVATITDMKRLIRLLRKSLRTEKETGQADSENGVDIASAASVEDESGVAS